VEEMLGRRVMGMIAGVGVIGFAALGLVHMKNLLFSETDALG